MDARARCRRHSGLRARFNGGARAQRRPVTVACHLVSFGGRRGQPETGDRPGRETSPTVRNTARLEYRNDDGGAAAPLDCLAKENSAAGIRSRPAHGTLLISVQVGSLAPTWPPQN